MRSIFEITDSTGNSGPDLIALEDLKDALGITVDTEDDALESRITRASNMLSEMCDRRFAFTEAVETFVFGTDEGLLPRQALNLRLFPIVEIESVVSNDMELEYEFDAESGRLWLVNGGWSGRVVVTYSGGFELPDDAPARLQEAVIAIVRDGRIAATSSDSSSGALRQVTHGDTSVGYYAPTTETAVPGVLPAGVADIVRAYHRTAV